MPPPREKPSHPSPTSQTLYCVAGGTAHELGFLLDLEPEVFERCMDNNYYSSLYPAQAVLKTWVNDDRNTAATPSTPRDRKIVFVNGTASLVPAPGYLAYSAAKSAQRALADTMRVEVKRYNNPKSTYSVHCVFAHNFITLTFIEEQKNKPALTKRLEGTEGDLAELERKSPSARDLAPGIVRAVGRGADLALVDGRFESMFCWGTGMASSLRRGWGIWDSCLALVAWVVWPFVRRGWEGECERDAWREKRKEL